MPSNTTLQGFSAEGELDEGCILPMQLSSLSSSSNPAAEPTAPKQTKKSRKDKATTIDNNKPRSSTGRVRKFRQRKKQREIAARASTSRASTTVTTYQSDSHTPIAAADNSDRDHDTGTATTEHVEPEVPQTTIQDTNAHKEFIKKFKNNAFGYACAVCDRLWFQSDLKQSSAIQETTLRSIIPNFQTGTAVLICSTCKYSLDENKIPPLSTFNGFKYREIPPALPPLDLNSERIISPRLPFMQIIRLRHVEGQFGIYGQVINVPVNVNTMVNQLPRNVDDDHCINVHIKRRLTHKTNYLQGMVRKRTIRTWLNYLVGTPLYQLYNITIDNSFLQNDTTDNLPMDDISENIPIEESLTALQETLMWNEDKFLALAPGERNLPQSLLFDEHAEELSFPAIFLGQPRTFRDEVRVTPFMMATSELRRTDRRGVTPQHLLYVAMKIMRIRVRDSLTIAFKHVGKNTSLTRAQIESDLYINDCIESNLAFLKSIPNSAWYWSERKRDLFAMIRQLGKPTVFLTMSANEIGWPNLLQLLHRLKTGEEIISQEATNMHFIQKSNLINNDAVTCAIYFNKLVNVVMSILQSQKISPFGQYRVTHYFKRIEFQHRGSPHAHILLWLEKAPEDPLGVDYQNAISMIDKLISVQASEASGNIKLQKHKHTFTCFKKCKSNTQQCRSEAPFMPSRHTMLLTPMLTTDPSLESNKLRYTTLRLHLEQEDYPNIDIFYERNNVQSDEDYRNILRAGITRPRVFYKRTPAEKWHNPFNPFIFNVLRSNMDIQFITEEYSCAAFVVEYVNKTDRGVSNLSRLIRETMEENPDFGQDDIARKLGVDMLNTVEMTSQEAAWYLLREPMSKCSDVVVYIPTVWPIERERIRNTKQELDELECGADCTDIWKENHFDKYEKRPQDLEDVSLAQFVAQYTKNRQGQCTKRIQPRIIRYRNFDITDEFNEYRREMVTLHIPFRNEEEDVLAEMKFITIYEQNRDLILQKRKEFESNLDIAKTIQICRQLCREDEENGVDDHIANAQVVPEPDPFIQLLRNPNADANRDLRLATLKNLGAIVKKKENIMSCEEFYAQMRNANEKQQGLLLHVISHLLSSNPAPLQVFFTGPAGCGKTYVIRLLMEIYNRFTDNDGFCNSYITCASTGKAAVAINGVTVHTALKLTLSGQGFLSIETIYQFRALFKYVKVLIIDEVSMIGAELLTRIDARLKQITGNFDAIFGGIDIFLIGDLRQLPPVKATPIYKQPKQTIAGPLLWRSLKFYELTQVMRQSNVQFSNVLTKLGNGEVLDDSDLELIESRFFSEEESNQRCPHGIRLFLENHSVEKYNNSILSSEENKIESTAIDVYSGHQTAKQLAAFRQKFHKMKISDTGGLPHTLVLNKPYIITTNIDVSDGLLNGVVGNLLHLEQDAEGNVTRLWLEFPDSPKTGDKIRKKAAAHIQAHNLPRLAVPITRRNSTITLNKNKTTFVKRNHIPLIPGCAMTIHKSQGGTFQEIVYQYSKTHCQQLLYVALSRVTSVDGLFITPKIKNDIKFYHGRTRAACMDALQQEFRRLSLNKLDTIDQSVRHFIDGPGLSLFSFNCQSLRAHTSDLTDIVVQKCSVLLLSETWMGGNDNFPLTNFQCIASYKREQSRAGGVAIFHNNNDTTNVVTPHAAFQVNDSNFVTASESNIGDVCAAECITTDGTKVILVAIYISPKQSVRDIIQFIHRALLAYTVGGNAVLNQDLHTIPLNLSGDFNVNFAHDDSKMLTEFLKKKLCLTMSNDHTYSTTQSGTTLDAVFVRFLPNFHSRLFISYFSYHKPIISFLSTSTQTNISET